MRLTYYGHSAFELDLDGQKLLFDPFITGNRHAEGVVTPGELKPDVLFLTHAHGDHWGDAPEIARKSGALVVANFEITEYLARIHGYEHAQAVNTGGGWSFPWGRIRATYARHSSSFPDGSYGGVPLGYLLHAAGRTIYNAGDTCYFSEMRDMAETESIDLAFLPIGDCFTMGIDEAVRVARLLRPGITVPIHYNTFPAIEVNTDDWLRKMEAAGLDARLLRAGETLEF